MMKNLKLVIPILLLFSFEILAQPRWKKSEPTAQVKLQLFHSTETANFPTTETLGKFDLMYEISHRFIPSIKDGYDVYFGLDGPARIRTAIGFGITEDLMVTLGRSNDIDNLDLQFKQRLIEFPNDIIPSVIAVRAGIAWNTEVPDGIDRKRTDGDNFQYYAQLIYNGMLFDKKLGIGIVPSYLYNSFIYAVDKQYTFTLGTYVQYYIDAMWSFWVEYNPVIAGYRGVIRLDERGKSHNSVAIGMDIETGGHIFHLILTNNARLNPSQYLVGADRSANDDMWRLGFGIKRYF
ncbi:MAG: hypothetical protein HND52_13400 [Ignavibacteriae bacterium]|nr:hypothetical protein [Ignavibacteriota bacterium]NOG98949.1 hypothetical protein [Ignavibacteriota bacterium]